MHLVSYGLPRNYLGLKERPCLASKQASAFPQFSAFLMDGGDNCNCPRYCKCFRFNGLQKNDLGLKERPLLASKLASTFQQFSAF
jgi:hypothetical protein